MPYKPPQRERPSIDPLVVKDALKLMPASSRRLFLRQTLTIGGLAMLTGCDLAHNKSITGALGKVSKFNDRVQAWLFDPNRLAPTYPASMITRPFPFNAFYGENMAPVVDGATYRLELGGMIADKRPWTLDALRALPQESQITRHICVEGWSAIGQWGGVRFGDFLRRVGADTTAKYVGFKCADDYYLSIDMATALHPQTILALTYGGETLPRKYGFPMKLRMPTKLGYKNPKHIMSLYVTNQYPGGYWEDLGYNWFGGS
jgi:DMSO/TMAO reductase YedYZ molybdopterin-dependent catalytic subunit